MRKRMVVGLALISMLFGCRYWVWVVQDKAGIKKPEYTITLAPSKCNRKGCYAFELTIENHTDKDIEIVWDKTMHIESGQTHGGFMFAGVRYDKKEDRKPNDIVFPKARFQKNIYPYMYANWGKDRWVHRPIRLFNTQGVYLVLIVNGVEVRERLEITLERVRSTDLEVGTDS